MDEFLGDPAKSALLHQELYYYVVFLQFFSATNVDQGVVDQLCHDVEALDPLYVPFAAGYAVFLLKHRPVNPALPRAEVWVTDRFKINSLDSEEEQARKARGGMRRCWPSMGKEQLWNWTRSCWIGRRSKPGWKIW